MKPKLIHCVLSFNSFNENEYVGIVGIYGTFEKALEEACLKVKSFKESRAKEYECLVHRKVFQATVRLSVLLDPVSLFRRTRQVKLDWIISVSHQKMHLFI